MHNIPSFLVSLITQSIRILKIHFRGILSSVDRYIIYISECILTFLYTYFDLSCYPFNPFKERSIPIRLHNNEKIVVIGLKLLDVGSIARKCI